MPPAFHATPPDRAEAPFRRRTVAFLLVLVAHALLMLVLLRLAPRNAPSGPAVSTFELLPDVKEPSRADPEPERATRRQPRRAAPRAAPAAEDAPVAEERPFKLDIIELTPEDYASSHIARLPQRTRPSGAEAAESADAAEASASAGAPGAGPNGERLYDADWYRKPTQAELAYYLPRGAAPIGWATIACRTVADYRVDDCVEIDQSPAGSGLAAAMARAAWQFRVWPPRLGGRTLVGAWVRIRIEFTEMPADR